MRTVYLIIVGFSMYLLLPRVALGDTPKSLSFEALKKFHDEGLKAREFRLENPKFILVNDYEITSERIHPGGIADELDLRAMPLSRDVLLEYARIHNLRKLKLQNNENQEVRNSAISRAEETVGKMLLPNMNAINQLKLRREAWIIISEYFESAAKARGHKFDGIASRDVAGWKSTSKTSSPYTQAFFTVSSEIHPVKLIGKPNHRLEVMPSIRYRYYILSQTDASSWMWDNTYELATDPPPVANFKPGSRYYFRVKSGNLVGEPYPKEIELNTTDIVIPGLP